MKKYVPLIALLVIAIFVMPTHAVKPIPPTDQKTIVSAYSDFGFGGEETMITVPLDKQFILTVNRT